MIAAALLLLCQAPDAPTLHWPAWRGPTADGVAPAGVAPPLTWSEDSNVRWKKTLPGLGCSSPIVLGDRIYLTTAIDVEAEGVPAEFSESDLAALPPQPGAPVAEHLHWFCVLAVDRATGDIAWHRVVTKARPHEAEHETGSHASASIVTDGETLVACFGSRGLFGLSLDGEVRWSQELGRMTSLAGFGEGSSPVLHGDTVAVQWDEEGPSYVAAFDVATGERRWRVARAIDSSWGTPAVAVVDGVAQVVANGSDATRAYALADGRELWSCGGMSKNPTTSPVVANGIAYVTNSYRGNVTQAISLAGAAGELDPAQATLWTRARGAAYVPTPAVHDGRIWILRDSTGVLACLDAKSGEVRYGGARLSDVKRIHASPVVAAGRVYLASRDGRTVVIGAGDEFETLAENDLDDVFDATPAFVGDAIYLRGRSHLYCLGE